MIGLKKSSLVKSICFAATLSVIVTSENRLLISEESIRAQGFYQLKYDFKTKKISAGFFTIQSSTLSDSTTDKRKKAESEYQTLFDNFKSKIKNVRSTEQVREALTLVFEDFSYVSLLSDVSISLIEKCVSDETFTKISASLIYDLGAADDWGVILNKSSSDISPYSSSVILNPLFKSKEESKISILTFLELQKIEVSKPKINKNKPFFMRSIFETDQRSVYTSEDIYVMELFFDSSEKSAGNAIDIARLEYISARIGVIDQSKPKSIAEEFIVDVALFGNYQQAIGHFKKLGKFETAKTISHQASLILEKAKSLIPKLTPNDLEKIESSNRFGYLIFLAKEGEKLLFDIAERHIKQANEFDFSKHFLFSNKSENQEGKLFLQVSIYLLFNSNSSQKMAQLISSLSDTARFNLALAIAKTITNYEGNFENLSNTISKTNSKFSQELAMAMNLEDLLNLLINRSLDDEISNYIPSFDSNSEVLTKIHTFYLEEINKELAKSEG